MTCLQKDFKINFYVCDVIQHIMNQLMNENELYSNCHSKNKQDVLKDVCCFSNINPTNKIL